MNVAVQFLLNGKFGIFQAGTYYLFLCVGD